MKIRESDLNTVKAALIVAIAFHKQVLEGYKKLGPAYTPTVENIEVSIVLCECIKKEIDQWIALKDEGPEK